MRGLRDELREVEFTLNETKSAEGLCRAKIKLIQVKIGSKKQTSVSSTSADSDNPTTSTMSDGKADTAAIETRKDTRAGGTSESNGVAQTQTAPVIEEGASRAVENRAAIAETKPRPSEAIATGNSTAIALK